VDENDSSGEVGRRSEDGCLCMGHTSPSEGGTTLHLCRAQVVVCKRFSQERYHLIHGGGRKSQTTHAAMEMTSKLTSNRARQSDMKKN